MGCSRKGQASERKSVLLVTNHLPFASLHSKGLSVNAHLRTSSVVSFLSSLTVRTPVRACCCFCCDDDTHSPSQPPLDRWAWMLANKPYQKPHLCKNASEFVPALLAPYLVWNDVGCRRCSCPANPLRTKPCSLLGSRLSAQIRCSIPSYPCCHVDDDPSCTLDVGNAETLLH